MAVLQLPPADHTDGPEVATFCREFLTLNGSFAGQPFEPLEWMEAFLDDLFRFDPLTGRRVYRTYLLGVPRKNAKTTLAAAIGVYMLLVDRSDAEPQIVAAAGDRKQAKIVFRMAAQMIRASPELSEVCEIYASEIRNKVTGGTFVVVSADADLAHGLNPSMVIVDEYHVHNTTALYVALTSGSAMRAEPLTLVISTAGFDLEDSPLGQLYSYAMRVQAGEVEDPAMGCTWFGPPEGEFDHTDPAIWEACNPSWSIMNHAEMATACKQMPQSEFIRFRLNGWTATENAWLPAGQWRSLYRPGRHLQPGERVIVGFDGAWAGDSTGAIAVSLRDLHAEPIGHWEAPPDDPHWRAPASEVEEVLRAACDWFRVVEIAADPFRWEQSIQTLYDEGLPIVEYPTNSTARMVPATQAVYDAIMDAATSHNGDPAFARHLRNAILKTDHRGARITKRHRSSKAHIDLAIAYVVAVHRAILFREAEQDVEVELVVI